MEFDPAGPLQENTDFGSWVRARVDAEPYWFHRIRLAADLVTPGWSDPEIEKLPHFGLPDDMTGMRVLDIGCAEGFFSFESERRGASEVVAIDPFPDSIRRFNLCRDALGSRATAHLCSVYDLKPKTFGTFDLVLFFGVLYHLRHPLYALEKVFSVAAGSILLQTATWEVPGASDVPLAHFDPFGIESGPDHEGKTLHDPTVFWRPNAACVLAMLKSTGFRAVEVISTDPRICIVVRASGRGFLGSARPPDQTRAPWS